MVDVVDTSGLAPEVAALVTLPDEIGSQLSAALQAAFPDMTVWQGIDALRLGGRVRQAVHEALMDYLQKHGSPPNPHP